MDHVDIQGTRVPKLGLGTWQVESHEARQVVGEAIELGYRHIDTAQMYGNEAEVGAAIMSSGLPREDFFLTTKVWRDELQHDAVLRSFDQSLEKLGTDYVDLLLIHWPNEEVPLRETLTAFNEILEEGRARHVGVSNFPPSDYDAAKELAPIACNQVEFHVYLHRDPLVERAQRDGALLTAYCPLARGKVLEDPELAAIGERHGKSPAQIALRWLVQQPQVAAIPKASSRAHMQENLAIFDFELDEDEMRRIAALDQQRHLIDPDFAPQWGR